MQMVHTEPCQEGRPQLSPEARVLTLPAADAREYRANGHHRTVNAIIAHPPSYRASGAT